MPDDLANLREVAGSFLYRDDVLVLGQLERGGGFDVARGPAGHVVDNYRRGHSVSNRAEVRNDPALRWLVVHRRSMQKVRRASRFHFAREGNGLLGCIRCGTWPTRNAPRGLLDSDLDHAAMLGYSHRGSFTRGAARHQ